MKRKIFYFVILLSLIACSTYKEAYYPIVPSIDKPDNYIIEQIDINPKNFFYLKFEEYFETFEIKKYLQTSEIEQGKKSAARHNEASARLYRSVSRDSTYDDSKIVEEKYLYLENFDIHSSGRIIYFKTARSLRNSELKKDYNNKLKIHINTAKKVSLGYWYFLPSDTSYHLLMTNGTKRYQVVAKADKDSTKITFVEISHPNVDKYSRDRKSDQLLKVKSVMNVGQDDGLIFYRNIPSAELSERAIVFNKEYNIESFVFIYRNKVIKNVISSKSYIKTRRGNFAKERKGYMKSFVIPEIDRELFQNIKKVPNKKDKTEKRKS